MFTPPIFFVGLTADIIDNSSGAGMQRFTSIDSVDNIINIAFDYNPSFLAVVTSFS